MDETTSDEQLVHLARTGDDRAFEVLYARYAPRIAAFVRGMVHDHTAAEDITQEVFFNALRRMRDTDRSIAFRPWIYEIAKNACIDSYRRTSRTKEISYDADEGMAPADRGKLVSAGGAPEVAEVHQNLDHLQGAFGALSATHADVIVMRELEGLSYREIGERLGMSRPSVESTLFRARRRLEQEYEELITGERCKQVQSLLETGTGMRLRVTERRRMNRHLAWCQPCRVQARMAGVEVDTTTVPLRKKLGGLLPIPAFLRDRLMGAATSVLPGISGLGDPFAEWGRAAAAAIIVAAAGIGAGAAMHDGQAFGAQVPGGFTPHVASSTPAPASGRLGTTGATVLPASSTGAAGAGGQGGVSGAGSPTATQPGATSPSSSGGTAGGGSGSSSGSGSSGSGSGSAAGAGAGGQVPGLPSGTGTGSVAGGVRGAAGTVGGAVRGTTGAVGGAVQGTTRTVAGAVQGATGAVGGAVQGTTRTAGGAVQGTTRTAAGTVQGVAGTAGGAVRDTTTTAGHAVSGVTKTVAGAVRDVAASGGSPKKVTQAVGGAVQGTTQTAGSAVKDVTTTTGSAVQRTTTTATKTVQGTTTTAGTAVQGVTQTAGTAVQRTTSTATGAVQGTTTTAGKAVQGTTKAVTGVLGGLGGQP